MLKHGGFPQNPKHCFIVNVLMETFPYQNKGEKSVRQNKELIGEEKENE